MEHIREALDKAHLSLDGVREVRPVTAYGNAPQPKPAVNWTPPQVQLDPKLLQEHRIVAHAMSDGSHAAFNVLRTRVRAALTEKNWKSVGITSPTQGCGKTVVAINLAMSLARGSHLKTVLIDFDLRRPAVARTLGIKWQGPWVSNVLQGDAIASECFVQAGESLVVGLGGGSVASSSELLSGPKGIEMLKFVSETLRPDVLIFDLPPMGVGDDTLAFLPRTDSALLVAAAGHTSINQIDDCERMIAEQGKSLGVVLNKVPVAERDNYYY